MTPRMTSTLALTAVLAVARHASTICPDASDVDTNRVTV
jgi:hypothetical protein